ncbi:MAG TPA: hypothetical protein ENK18_07290 [Deltaproteobacteria bacterium]|nr:hypothetical protein [Deltaproteobacteria bacterium]
MGRLLAIFAGCSALLLVPLALSAPTAWLLVAPVHLALAGLTCAGGLVDGIAGRPEGARRWGLFYLLASLAMVAALELGGMLRAPRLMGVAVPGLYWGGAWCLVLTWGWFPPVFCGGMGVVGELRRRRRTHRVLRRRRAQRTR